MKDPVINPDGNTYERESIEKWLMINPTAPQTRNPLKISQLIPNRLVKSIVSSLNQFK